MRVPLRRLVLAAAATALVVAGSAMWARSYVASATAANRYSELSAVPARRVALVFGAGLTPDGLPTPMLADRVMAAVELYRAGKVRKLLFSGDNSRPNYNEVGAMLRYAVGRGVPQSDIALDYAGFDTYDSCYRARFIFGVTSAILVTPQYHLPRAVYDCTRLGISAVGLGTADWGEYGSGMMTSYEIRESLADLKSLWDVNVSHRAAALMGSFVGIR